jgi:hypothetical protein
VGEIISELVGGFIPERRAASFRNQQATVCGVTVTLTSNFDGEISRHFTI